MSWRYHQNNGLFEHDGHSISEAYAGKGQWRNQARYESIRGKGPLPRGRYTILPPLTHPTVGLYALRLVPAPTNHMYGRSGFLIHGPVSWSLRLHRWSRLPLISNWPLLWPPPGWKMVRRLA